MGTMPLALPLTHRAGFWLRGAAWGIDACLASAVGLVLSLGGLLAFHLADAPEGVDEYVAGILMNAGFLGYTTVEVLKAATPGKMMLGLVIARPDGGQADRWTLTLRWSTKQAPLLLNLIYFVTLNVFSGFLAGIMSYVVLIGCLQALDEHKQTWHDEWSGTAVVRRRMQARDLGPYATSTPPPLPGAGATP